MRKYICLLLAALMLLPCAYALEPISAEGEWVLTAVEANGETIGADALGLSIHISLHGDGTAVTINADKTPVPAAWVQQGSQVVIDSISAPFTLENGTLWVMNNDIKMIFTPDLSALRTDVLLEEFNGTWVCSRVDFGGMVMSLASIGAEWTLEILDGHVIFTNVTFGVENIYEADGEFIDGVLSFTYTDATDGIETTIPLRLNLGGEMVYLEEGSSTITYFSNVVEQPQA